MGFERATKSSPGVRKGDRRSIQIYAGVLRCVFRAINLSIVMSGAIEYIKGLSKNLNPPLFREAHVEDRPNT